MRTTKRERALKLNVIRAQLLKLGIPQMLHPTIKVTSSKQVYSKKKFVNQFHLNNTVSTTEHI